MPDGIEGSAAELVVGTVDSGEHGRLSLDDQASGHVVGEMVALEDPSCVAVVPTDPPEIVNEWLTSIGDLHEPGEPRYEAI
ncbi:hypothetical protein ACWFNS_18585 [Oerskovia enterophila]